MRKKPKKLNPAQLQIVTVFDKLLQFSYNIGKRIAPTREKEYNDFQIKIMG